MNTVWIKFVIVISLVAGLYLSMLMIASMDINNVEMQAFSVLVGVISAKIGTIVDSYFPTRGDKQE